MQAEIYKEDFEREREDREKAAGRVESLEISQLHKQLSSAQRDLASAREEVKQYKEQLDIQEVKVCLVIIINPQRPCVQ